MLRTNNNDMSVKFLQLSNKKLEIAVFILYFFYTGETRAAAEDSGPTRGKILIFSNPNIS